MDTSQQTLSSTMAATDLDRLSIQHFESGGSEGPKDEITVVSLT